MLGQEMKIHVITIDAFRIREGEFRRRRRDQSVSTARMETDYGVSEYDSPSVGRSREGSASGEQETRLRPSKGENEHGAIRKKFPLTRERTASQRINDTKHQSREKAARQENGDKGVKKRYTSATAKHLIGNAIEDTVIGWNGVDREGDTEELARKDSLAALLTETEIRIIPIAGAEEDSALRTATDIRVIILCATEIRIITIFATEIRIKERK